MPEKSGDPAAFCWSTTPALVELELKPLKEVRRYIMYASMMLADGKTLSFKDMKFMEVPSASMYLLSGRHRG